MTWSNPYVKISAVEAGEEQYYNDVIDNFYKCDRSWWSRTNERHSLSGGILWVRMVDIENQQAHDDYICVCEKCNAFGTLMP